jgi:PAS domain S-box-containing protein
MASDPGQASKFRLARIGCKPQHRSTGASLLAWLPPLTRRHDKVYCFGWLVTMCATFNNQAERQVQAVGRSANGDRELRELVDAVPQHIVVLDGDGRRLHANQVVLDYHGLALEEFLNEDTPIKCFHPEDLEKYSSLRQSGMTNGTPWEAEIRLRRKDGRYRWFLLRSNPLRNELGRVLRWYVSGTDIEDRKQAERELRQLVDAVPQHMSVIAPDGQWLYGNKVEMDFHGSTPEEFLEENKLKKKFHPDDLAGYWDTRQRGISRGIPFRAETRPICTRHPLQPSHWPARHHGSRETTPVAGLAHASGCGGRSYGTFPS